MTVRLSVALRQLLALTGLLILVGCGGGSSSEPAPNPEPPAPVPEPTPEPISLSQFSIEASDNSELERSVQFSLNGTQLNGATSSYLDASELIAQFEHNGARMEVAGQTQLSGQTRNDFTNPLTYKVMMADGRSQEYQVHLTNHSGLPRIYLSTDQQAPIDSKEEYVTGTVRIEGADLFDGLDDMEMKIRGRGNSTWFIHPKKPYQMKLDEKASVLGMPEDKKWLLLAEYSDKTLLRNTIAFELGHMSWLDWTPASEFADVYLNGDYLGTYNVAQKVEEDDDRVAIGDEGYLLEIDQLDRLDPDDVYFYSDQFLLNIKSPELTVDSEAYTYIVDRIDAFESALFSESFKDPALGYRAYIDLASFVDWYLISEITKNVDSKNFSSIYLNVMPEGPIKMGPLWDFDLAFGNVDYADSRYAEGFWIKQNPWYSRLFEDEWFVEQVRQRFAYYLGQQQAILEKVDETAAYLANAQNKNDNRWHTLGVYVWPNPVVYDTHSEEVAHLKSWLSQRMTWLEQAFSEL